MKGPRLSTRDAVVVVGTIGLVAAGILALWLRTARQSVWLVNALPLAVNVAFDGDRGLAVPQGGRISVSLAAGVHRVHVASAKGAPLADERIDVPGGVDVVAYNVFGAAPLYAESVFYGTGASGNPTVEFFGGRRVASRDGINYVFEEPPQSISVEHSSSDVHVRYRFDVAPGGWETTVGYLSQEGQLEAAARVCRDVALAQPENDRALECAAGFTARVRGDEAAAALLRPALARDPGNVELHRTYQHLLRRSDRFEALRTEYRARRDAAPDEPLASILLARVEAPELAASLYGDVLARHPDQLMARRGLAKLLLDTGHVAESASLFARVAAEDPDYRYYVDDHARALVELGRPQDAVAVTAKVAEDAKALDWRIAVLYARLSHLGGITLPQAAETYIERVAKPQKDPGWRLWMRSLAGLGVEAKQVGAIGDEDMRAATAIHLAALRDPAEAWPLCAKARPNALRSVATPVILLLAAEFDRAGDADLAASLYDSAAEVSLPASALRAYAATGVEHPELWRLDPDERAALDLARARRLEADGKDARALYAAVQKEEPIPGVVARAAAAWPKPGPVATTVLRRKAL